MKLSLDADEAGHAIKSYEPGAIRLGGDRRFTRSVVISPRRILEDWPPQVFEDLEAAHLELLLELDPEIVILGTGSRQHLPHPRLTRVLLERGIGVEAMDTAAACRTYNIILAEGRRVVAALLMI